MGMPQQIESLNFAVKVDTPAGAAEAMRLDRQLLEAFERGDISPALRLYTWKTKCITYGYRQTLEEARRAAGAVSPDDMAVRPTGGGIVIHEPGDITFALVLPLHASQLGSRYREAYTLITRAFWQLFRERGVDVEWGAKDAAGLLTRNVTTRSGHGSERSEESDDPGKSLSRGEECRVSGSAQGGSERFRGGNSASPCMCFAKAEPHEVTEAGQKILGVAQRRGRRAMLQQGTLKRGIPGMSLAGVGTWLNGWITDQDLLKRTGH